MTIKKDNTKDLNLNQDSFTADGDLTNYQNCAVMYSAQSAGRTKVKAPTGSGVLPAGILMNTADDPATDGKSAEVQNMGIGKGKANGAFNAGIELTIADTAGTLKAATSGDYVIGISEEAASAAGHLIRFLITIYQKN